MTSNNKTSGAVAVSLTPGEWDAVVEALATVARATELAGQDDAATATIAAKIAKQSNPRRWAVASILAALHRGLS